MSQHEGQHGRTTPAAVASTYSAAATAAADKLIARESTRRTRTSVQGTRHFMTTTTTTTTMTTTYPTGAASRVQKDGQPSRAVSTGPNVAVYDDGIIASLAFLLRMADNFALEGNLPESVKSAETALLLRKSRAHEVQQALDRFHNDGSADDSSGVCPEDVSIIPATMDLQGKNLVLQCNSYAVTEFSHKRFDTATFFLNKALFLTEAGGSAEDYLHEYADQETDGFLEKVQQTLRQERDGAGAASMVAAIRAAVNEPRHNSQGSFCFSAEAEEDRLRLRAATFNNIGCMERRRGRLDEALGFLRKAIHMESQLGAIGAAATTTASPSTYLNLCTVLNELGLHQEAVAAAQSAVAALQQHLLEQTAADDKARVALMLMVGQYNLGVSLERRGQKRDAEAAQRAYQQSLDTSRRYNLVAGDCPTIDAAVAAMKRMKGQLPPDGSAKSPSAQQQQQTGPLRPSPPDGSARQEWTLGYNMAEMAYNLHAAPVQSQESEKRWAEAAERRLAYPLAADTAAAAAAPPPQAAVNRLTSTAPPGFRSHISEADKEGASVRRAAPRHGSADKANPNATNLAAEDERRSVSATWHPSTNSRSLDQKAPAQLTPRQPMVEAPAASLLTPRTASSASASVRSNPFAVSEPTRVPPPQVHSQQHSNTSTLLRPPRAPGHGAGSGSSGTSPRPVLPPTLAPLFGARPDSASRSNISALGGGSSTKGSRHAMVPAPPSLSSTPGAAAAVASVVPSLSRRSIAGNTSGVGGEQHGSFTSTSGPLQNPFGRRMFGSTAIHQQQQLQSPPPGSTMTSSYLGGYGHAAAGNGPNGSQGHRSSGASSAVVSRQQQQLLKEQREMARAKRMQERQRRQNKRMQERQVAQQDAELANELYEQMVAGMQHEELARCHEAAIAIQRVWRGVVARTWIRTMMDAATRLQRVTRAFLVKVREEHRLAELARQRVRAEQVAKEQAASRVIQARVRQFICRLQIRREYVARQRRLFFAARTIQRAYRGYLQRKEDMLAALAEAHRREDEQRGFRRKVAARRIQAAYRQYQERKAELAALETLQQRNRAATKIQAVVRGVLTRAWFRYYRAYRHDQAMRSAASQRKLTTIQTFCRALLSAQYCEERKRQLLLERRQRRLALAATRIQGMWRQHVARIHLERLRAEKARADRLATIIQRWYLTQVARRAFLAHCETKRRERAAQRIQAWVRALWVQRKERAFALYHAEKLREQQLLRLKQWALPVLHASLHARQSALLVASMRATHTRNETTALLLQRVGRGFAGRTLVAFEQDMARRVAHKERELACRVVAARVIQRAWRVALAKDEVEQRRREQRAATVLARSYRCYRARLQLHELRVAHQQRLEDHAARTLQAAWRAYGEKRRAQEMKAYYGTQHRKKMWRARRDEAAVMIQSLWRGHVTRQAMARVLAERQCRTRAAITIQRGWRGIAQRETLRAEVAQRVARRNHKAAAALKIQCFWRKMTAAERVARLREETHLRAQKALVLQCWWRGVLAKRVLARQRYEQEEEEALAVLYAAKWERAATCINAFLRAYQSGLHSQQTLHDSLLHRLHAEDQVRFRKRHSAATAIQKVYRGYYARCCYKSLLREKRARDKRAADREAREHRAARRIQCCFRAHRARQELAARRVAQREDALNAQEDLVAAADPHQLVRELFWVHDLVRQRDTTAERVARARKHHEAAVTVQKAYRNHRAHRAAAHAADEKLTARAVSTIETYYGRHRAAMAVRDAQRREQAATLLQAHVRGWLVRRRWAAWRADLEESNRVKKEIEDVLDAAATSIQSAWRRFLAQREAGRRRQLRALAKEQQMRDEAAATIQSAFRTFKEERTHWPGEEDYIANTGANGARDMHVYHTY